MILNTFLVFGSVFFVFSLISKRIQGTIITLPILFTFAGFALHGILNAPGGLSFSEGGLHTLAEITLILVLAADASQISKSELWSSREIPIRLLLIGLPLVMGFGFILGLLIFPGEPWYLLALLAAILAPTDAALGASVLSNETIPKSIRQGLNVESGLNDGIALPVVLFFACFLNHIHQTGEENWLSFVALQLSIGPLAGIIIGWIGGKLISTAANREWITNEFQGIAAIALAIIAFATAETFHGNGFIAAFVAGLTYGNISISHSKFMHEFTETESQFLAQLTFFLFGALILPDAVKNVDMMMVIYAVMSITFVRMLAVWIAMIGTKIDKASVLFMGWFGPRGLASILFVLLILEDLNIEQIEFAQTIVAVTVVLSIILHGVTAAPLSRRLGARFAQE